jgi:hypothetical protein
MFASVVTQTFSYSSSDLLRSGPHTYLNSVNSIVGYAANLARNRSIPCFLFFHVISKVRVCLPTLGQPLEVFISYYSSSLLKSSTSLSTPSSANAMSGVYESSSETTSGSGSTTGKGIPCKS